MTRRIAAFVLLAVFLTSLAGCNAERSYHLWGNVTFQGKPVPTGHIVFEPDASAGNSGPPAFAKIKDGHYDTREEDGRGTIGGPHIITIHGRDGIARGELLNGLPLFTDYNTTADLPKGSGEQNFEVPGDTRK